MAARHSKQTKLNHKLSINSSAVSSHNGINKNLKEIRLVRAQGTKKTYQVFDPVLTPLHRLKKFKAIRDKNLRQLKKKVRPPTFTMEVDTKTEIPGSSADIASMKTKIAEPQPSNGEREYKNGLNGNDSTHSNGHADEVPPVLEPEVEIRKSPRKSPRVDKKVSDSVSVDGSEISMEAEVNDDCHSDITSHSQGDLDENGAFKVLRRSTRHPERKATPTDSARSSVSKESSVASSVDPDLITHYNERLKRRPSGRRALRQSPAETLRKRKAEEDSEISDMSPDSKRHASGISFSIPSPGWKFFSSPFSRFWPRKKPAITEESEIEQAPCSTPFKNPKHIESDSMLVNFDEQTINKAFDDSIISDTVTEVKPTGEDSNKKWFNNCSVM